MSISSAIPQSIINNVSNISNDIAAEISGEISADVAVAVESSLLETANAQTELILQLLPDITQCCRQQIILQTWDKILM